MDPHIPSSTGQPRKILSSTAYHAAFDGLSLSPEHLQAEQMTSHELIREQDGVIAAIMYETHRIELLAPFHWRVDSIYLLQEYDTSGMKLPATYYSILSIVPGPLGWYHNSSRENTSVVTAMLAFRTFHDDSDPITIDLRPTRCIPRHGTPTAIDRQLRFVGAPKISVFCVEAHETSIEDFPGRTESFNANSGKFHGGTVLEASTEGVETFIRYCIGTAVVKAYMKAGSGSLWNFPRSFTSSHELLSVSMHFHELDHRLYMASLSSALAHSGHHAEHP